MLPQARLEAAQSGGKEVAHVVIFPVAPGLGVVSVMFKRVLIATLFSFAVSTLPAQNQPSFELRRDSQIPFTENIVAQGDFNGDGKPDLVFGSGTLLSQLGNGDGSFGAPFIAGYLPLAGDSLVEISAVDINNDGKLDLIGVGVEGTAYIFLGDGTGHFAYTLQLSTAAYAESITAGDFNGDGLPDLAVGDIKGGVELFLNQGGFHFLYTRTIPVGTGVNPQIVRLRAAQVDGTGADDLVVLTFQSAYVLWAQGNLAFQLTQLASYQATADLNVGDLNQDGRADILVSYNCGGAEPYPSKTPYYLCAGVDVFYGQGNHTTFHRLALTDQGVRAARPWAADINGDGIADLVSGTRDQNGMQGGLFVWLGHADGSFSQTPLRYIATGDASADVIPGDFNRDGKMDFVDESGELYLNASNPAPCATSAISPTVLLCSPIADTYATRAVPVQATAFSRTTLTGLQLYVDGAVAFSRNAPSFNVVQTLSPGRHLLVAKGWDASGLRFRSTRQITVFDGTPGATCAAAPGTASLCLPEGSAHSPIHIVANAWPTEVEGRSAVPTAAQLYVDNQLVVNDDGCGVSYCRAGSSSLDTDQTLSPGSHQLVFKVFDANGSIFTATRQINVP